MANQRGLWAAALAGLLCASSSTAAVMPLLTRIGPAVTVAEREDTRLYKVVMNHEEQYSIWPVDRENALGWTDAGKTGTKAECLAWIKEVWTDMRPQSLRKAMETSGDAPPARAPVPVSSPPDQPAPPAAEQPTAAPEMAADTEPEAEEEAEAEEESEPADEAAPEEAAEPEEEAEEEPEEEAEEAPADDESFADEEEASADAGESADDGEGVTEDPAA